MASSVFAPIAQYEHVKPNNESQQTVTNPMLQPATPSTTEELLEIAQRLKQLGRIQLAEMNPADAQKAAEAVLDPACGHVVDESQLAWPGDLADDWEPASD